MYKLLNLFFEICLFKKGPQDIPASNGLLRLLIPVYAGISFLLLILNTDGFSAILQVLVEIGLILTLSWIILFFAKKPARYLQTACALMATEIIVGFIALPAMAIMIGQGSALAFIVIILLMLWQWAISDIFLAKHWNNRLLLD